MKTDEELLKLDESGDLSTLADNEKKRLKILKAKLKAKKTKQAQKDKQEQKDKELVDKWTLPTGKKHFTITSWQSACLWEYKGTNTHCAICKEPLQSLCVQCSSSSHVSKNTDEKCSVSSGKCNHLYHEHCISNWLRMPGAQNKKCPHCAVTWEYSTKAM